MTATVRKVLAENPEIFDPQESTSALQGIPLKEDVPRKDDRVLGSARGRHNPVPKRG